jgi:hypothetical protein
MIFLPNVPTKILSIFTFPMSATCPANLALLDLISLTIYGEEYKLQSFSMLCSQGKVVPVIFLTEHYAMKAYWNSGGISPRIP